MHTLQTRTLVATALCATLWCVASPAAAQKSDGNFQLGLNVPIASYESYTVEQSGVDEDAELSGIEWGVPGTATLELGYGIGKLAVVGGLLRAEGESLKVDPPGPSEEDRQTLRLSVGPKLDLVFSPGEEIRPFVGIAGGYVASWTSADVQGGPNRESSSSGFFGTGRFGFRIFATKTFSIDPMVVFNYRKEDETRDDGIDVADIDLELSGFDVGLALGFSGWI